MPLRARAYIGAPVRSISRSPLLKSDGAAVGLDQPDDHIERRRLTRAVGAEQADDFARLHVGGDAVDDGSLAVPFDEAAHFDRWSFAHCIRM